MRTAKEWAEYKSNCYMGRLIESDAAKLIVDFAALESFCEGLKGVNDELRKRIAEVGQKLLLTETARDIANTAWDQETARREATEKRIAEVEGERDRREANGIALFKAQHRADRAEAERDTWRDGFNKVEAERDDLKKRLAEAEAALKGASMALHYEVGASIRHAIMTTVDAALTHAHEEEKK